VLNFIYTPVSWVLLQWHHLFNLFGLDEAGGVNWTLSIIFLVITARLLLFRLFVKQVKYQRQMQKLQPELQKLRKKYKDDRAAMQREMMAFQQEHGFNPVAGCLPMFLQLPVFYGLYHVLRHLSNSVPSCHKLASDPTFHDAHLALYTFKPSETCHAAQAKLFGAPLASHLTDTTSQLHALGGDRAVTTAVILVLVLISESATFTTQLLVRAGNPVQAEGTAATVQKLMLYLIPLGTLGSGLFFPLGVLLYWFTSNTWTMCQQLYINKFHPHEDKVAEQTRGQVGKALAPKPGQKPERARKAGPSQPSLVKESEPDEAAADSSAPPARNTPRPGQRPQRTAAKRPPGKRPTQAKKRR
jgi:YidC/Oxa1 family membrane protein insertase